MVKFPLSKVLSFKPIDNGMYGEQAYAYFDLKRFRGTEDEDFCENLRMSPELTVRMRIADNLEVDVLRIPRSKLRQFKKKHGALRWGQELHTFLELYKVTDPASKLFCDMLYTADSATAHAMVKLVVDENN